MVVRSTKDTTTKKNKAWTWRTDIKCIKSRLAVGPLALYCNLFLNGLGPKIC